MREERGPYRYRRLQMLEGMRDDAYWSGSKPGEQVRAKLLKGIGTLADAVRVTLGPKARTERRSRITSMIRSMPLISPPVA